MISVYNILNRIFEEPDPLSSDMWRSIGDSTYVFNHRCNILGSSALSMGLLYMNKDIGNWAKKQG